MTITSHLFEAFLKCPTKCHLRSLGEIGAGNEYAEWVRAQDESYEREAVRRLQETVPEAEHVSAPPTMENLKTAQWQLAVDVELRVDRSADSLVRTGQPLSFAIAVSIRSQSLSRKMVESKRSCASAITSVSGRT